MTVFPVNPLANSLLWSIVLGISLPFLHFFMRHYLPDRSGHRSPNPGMEAARMGVALKLMAEVLLVFALADGLTPDVIAGEYLKEHAPTQIAGSTPLAEIKNRARLNNCDVSH